MRVITVAALALAVGLSLAACGRDAEQPAAVEERQAARSSRQVLEEAAEAAYEPPADGRLHEEQVEMYVEVQERAAAIREAAARKLEEEEATARREGREMGLMDAMRALGEVGDVVAANLRAAQELGYDPVEYQWVETRVLAAWGHLVGRQVAALDDAARTEALPPDERHNLELVRRYEAEIRAGLGDETAGDDAAI